MRNRVGSTGVGIKTTMFPLSNASTSSTRSSRVYNSTSSQITFKIPQDAFICNRRRLPRYRRKYSLSLLAVTAIITHCQYQFLKHLSSEPSNKVIGVARNPAAVQSQVDTDGLPNVLIVKGDLTDAASLNAAAKEAAGYTDGAVDYLIVNGAYMSAQSMFLKPTDYIGQEKYFHDELTTSINTNTAGVLYAINAFLPYVRKSSIKKVVVISSGHADTEFIGIADVADAIPYAVSKAAANVIVAKYAAQFKDEGLIFLALSPGVVLTLAPSLDDRTFNIPFRSRDVRANSESLVPPEAVAVFERMTKQFQKYEPSYNGPMTPAQSVEMQLKVIEGVTTKDSGAFLSHLGSKQWL